MKKLLYVLGLLAVLVAPVLASAHEVYVLPTQEVQQAIHTPSVSPLVVIQQNIGQFTFWFFIVLISILFVFFISISRRLERMCAPFFARTKHWAPTITRVTVGISFIAAAYYQASYGPELPLAATYGPYTPLVTVILVLIGILITFGWWARAAAAIALVMYAVAVYHHGWYMLTYTNYLGEILALLIVSGHGVHKFAMFITRVFFGIALIFTSFYAKILYSNLALDTVKYTDPSKGIFHPLTYYLHFTPSFLVLGAACIEILIGLFFVFGIEIRFTAVFLNFWLFLSLIHFGEIVWPHIILIGIPIGFFFYGYDEYSLEGYFFKKRDLEPVL